MLDKSNQAERLGISEAELQALLDVRDDLESGRIKKGDFIMYVSSLCIGGHMAYRLKTAPDLYVRRATHTNIDRLFSPRIVDGYFASREEAVRAIDRWIASDGEEAW